MYMVTSSIDAESRAADLTNDAAEVCVQILFEIGLDQSAALFGAEDEMHQQIRSGVRHSLLSPLRGLLVFPISDPRLTPWATFLGRFAAAIRSH